MQRVNEHSRRAGSITPRAATDERRGRNAGAAFYHAACDLYVPPTPQPRRPAGAVPEDGLALVAPGARTDNPSPSLQSPLTSFLRVTCAEQRLMVEDLIDAEGKRNLLCASEELLSALVEEIRQQIAALFTLNIGAALPPKLRGLIVEYAFGPIGKATHAACTLKHPKVCAKKDTHLHHHAKEGDIEDVHLLLAQAADVNARDKDGRTSLHHAAGKGWLDIVACLLEKRADVNASGGPWRRGSQYFGFSALDTAAQSGRLPVVRLLVACQADLEGRRGLPGTRGYQTLDWAAENGYVEICQFAIEKRANPHERDDKGRTPAFWALVRGHTETLKLLLRGEADPNACSGKAGNNLLQRAVKKGDQGAVRVLLQAKADATLGGGNERTPLELAIARKDDDATWAMLHTLHETKSKGVTLDTALELAMAQKNHDAIVALLTLRPRPPMRGLVWGSARILYAAEEEIIFHKKAIAELLKQHPYLPDDIVREICRFGMGKRGHAYGASTRRLFWRRVFKGIF